jgi:acyl-CoA ligase (AMP-forming) (exosortase A-associated)
MCGHWSPPANGCRLLAPTVASCHDLRHVIVTGSAPLPATDGPLAYLRWDELLLAGSRSGHRVIDTDMAAILYTSGSTGKPKGVVLSHRNMVAGAKSVASYLDNNADDTLLAALPLSFDAGFSQLTTAFHAGARVVLLNYLLPRDVLKTLAREKVTGLTAVPPLYIQLSELDWPAEISEHLRYFANTGGRMPRETLAKLRAHLPKSKPFLMYGLTEAFRSTYLPPEEVDRRPDSIGKAIPNAEILVLREDGSACAAHEPGELVHRGALVGMGYWNDHEKTAERYKPLPANTPGRDAGLVLPEIAVFSGDTVRSDEEGFLYFIGRRDEMMKTSGYRVSPTEVEEVLYATRLVGECVAFGVDHPTLGHAIQVIATPGTGGTLDTAALLTECRRRMPAYMVPAASRFEPGPCHATRTEKSTAKCWPASFLRTQRWQQTPANSTPASKEAASDSTPAPPPSHAPMRQFPIRDGELVVGGMPLTRLAARVGQTPFYAYDRGLLTRRVAELRAALPPALKLHYAMKANPMPALVCHMAGLVDGIDVASGGELKVALDAGANPRETSFAGPANSAPRCSRQSPPAF